MTAIDVMAKALSPGIFEEGRQGGWVRRERKRVRQDVVRMIVALTHYDEERVFLNSDAVRDAAWVMLDEYAEQEASK